MPALHEPLRSGRETLAPSGAPALQDCSAPASRHSRSEPVPTLATAHVRLIGAFHVLLPKKAAPAGPSAQYRPGLSVTVFHTRRLERLDRKRCSTGRTVVSTANQRPPFHTCGLACGIVENPANRRIFLPQAGTPEPLRRRADVAMLALPFERRACTSGVD